MNNFHLMLDSVLDSSSQQLELFSSSRNKLSAIYNGVVYPTYFELPLEARFAIARATAQYYVAYNMIREQYSADEAEERIAWCLFGSLDSQADINVKTGAVAVELSAHCQKCQYAKPFCSQILPYLSRREQQAFLLMRKGLSDKEVASKMSITLRTLHKHTSNALQRLTDVAGQPINRQYIISKLMEAGA